MIELSPVNITTNLEEWEADLGIMFYAPWCKYCKQLLPSWATISELTAGKKNLVIGKFNCEGSSVHVDLCKKLVVDRYPTLLFLGYGNFNQGPNGALIGKSPNPRLVRFVSDIYPEAVYDWITMLSFLSGAQRRWDDIVGFFTGKSRTAERLKSLKAKKDAAERKAMLFGQELEKYKANELFDSLDDNGDPFPLAHEMQPDEVLRC